MCLEATRLHVLTEPLALWLQLHSYKNLWGSMQTDNCNVWPMVTATTNELTKFTEIYGHTLADHVPFGYKKGKLDLL